jgi:hypothetical protein
VKRLLSPTERGVQEHLVGRGVLAALLGELHVQVDLLGHQGPGALRGDGQPDPGRGIQLDDELVGSGAADSAMPNPSRGGRLKTSRSSSASPPDACPCG